MHVAVAIVGFRNAQDIVRCLRALEKSTHQDFEVIICENGGEAAFADLTAALPTALPGGQPVRSILAACNLGYGGGLNVCFRETPKSDAWWVLNPDTAPHPEAMARQVEKLAMGEFDAVGCTLQLPSGEVQSRGGRWNGWLGRAVSIGHGTSIDEVFDADVVERMQNYLNGASMMISRRFLESVGPLREDYFLYCEEVEWCLRSVASGMRLGFAPKAVVLHYQGTTTGNGPDVNKKSRMPTYLNERNKILTTRDCYAERLPVVAVATFMILFARYGRRGAWKQFMYGFAGWAAGLRDERGAPKWIQA